MRGKGIRVHALCPGVIDTAIVRTSTMRGSWERSQASAVRFSAKRGTSPDVVARDALRATRRGRIVVPSPSWQVTPGWLLERFAPMASRRVSAMAMKALGPKH